MYSFKKLLEECETSLSAKTDFIGSNVKQINSLLDIVTKIKTIKTLELAIEISKATLKKIKEDDFKNG